jgi:TolB-like protein/Tfp pilus assembly protein PilF
MEQALKATARPSPLTTRATWRSWASVAATAVVATLLISTLWRASLKPSPAPEPTSIAVLPLTYISGQDDAPYLADGLTDELITTLGQVGALRVTAHTSVLRFRHTTESVASVARALGVGSVLEGSVAVQGSPSGGPRVRVNLRLIRAGTDVDIWSGSFERPLSDRLALQSDIARAVAQNVHAALTPQESLRLAKSATTNGPAQLAYLEGIAYLAQNRRGAEVRPALEALQRAIALDSTFAAPYAAAARTYILLAGDGEIPQTEAYAAAKAAAHRALDLDPALADAHVALADVSFFYEWDWAAADAEYRRAIDLSESGAFARTRYANLLAALGRTDAARQHADHAVSLDPLNADVRLTSGLMAYYQRHFDEASEILHRVIAMDPRFPGAYRTLARIEEARGNILDAIDLTDRAIRLSDYGAARAAALSLRAQAGQPRQARQGLTQLQARLAAENRPLGAPYEAYVRLALGERDVALDLLSQAVAARDRAVLWMGVDPRLDPLRSDPRFQALLTRLGRP